jgi:hypothetical protein
MVTAAAAKNFSEKNERLEARRVHVVSIQSPRSRVRLRICFLLGLPFQQEAPSAALLRLIEYLKYKRRHLHLLSIWNPIRFSVTIASIQFSVRYKTTVAGLELVHQAQDTWMILTYPQPRRGLFDTKTLNFFWPQAMNLSVSSILQFRLKLWAIVGKEPSF